MKSSIWHDKSYNDVYVYNEIDVWYTDVVRWYNKAIRELFSCENVSNMIVGQLGVIISRLTMISFINFTHLVSLLLYGSLFAFTAVALYVPTRQYIISIEFYLVVINFEVIKNVYWNGVFTFEQ